MSRTQKPYVPTAVRQKRETAIAQAQCHGGWHRMTPTFRPGEQLCTRCGVVTYCQGCLDQYQLPPSRSTRAFPQACALHQGTQGQTATQQTEVQA